MNFINLMTYDYHGDFSKTAQNSPLYAGPRNPHRGNIDATINAWIGAGARPQKLLLGLAFYGRSFTLADANRHGVDAPAIGPGTAGPHTKANGMLSYREVCLAIRAGGWTVKYETRQQCYYAYKGNQWMGFDGKRSIKAKCQYAKRKNLGGVMMWAIDFDDDKNQCGYGAYPLLNAIREVI